MTTDPLYSGTGVPERNQPTTAAAKEEARGVAHEAAASASAVGGVAKQEASTVAHEAAYQAKDLLAQSRRELMDQAAQQQSRAAEGLRSIHRELSSMASNSEQPGVGTDLVRQAADRTASLADWLDQRDPGSLLNEVKSYARRRPGMFLAIAAGAGLLAGRLSRSLVAEATEDRTEGMRYRTAVPEGYDRTRMPGGEYVDAGGYRQTTGAMGGYGTQGYPQTAGAAGAAAPAGGYGTQGYGQTTGAAGTGGTMGEDATPSRGQTTGEGGYAGSKGYGEAAASAGVMAGSQSYDEGAMGRGAGTEGAGAEGARGGTSGDAYQTGPGEAPYGAPAGGDAYPPADESENAAQYGTTDRGSEYATPSEAAGKPIPGVGDKQGKIPLDEENRMRREGDEQR